MSIEGQTTGSAAERLTYGMVGGGRGAFIGAVHRMAARLDDRYQLVAGALSSEPERARQSARDLGISQDRCYASFDEMAAAEARRADPIDVAVIVTPNNTHYAAAAAFLKAGIHVICDKPMTTTVHDALSLVHLVEQSGKVFVLTQNNTGYAMVRQARAMIEAGVLGRIRVVQVAYAQDWLTNSVEKEGHKQALWRTDAALAGPGGCIGDIGVHAYNLAAFMTGLTLDSVSADLSSFGQGRALDDNAHVLLRFRGGARGMLWASQVAPGNNNALSIKVYGEKGGLEWLGESPDNMRFSPIDQPPHLIVRGGPGANEVAAHATRMPAGHPEGYVEGFANIYSDAAELILAAKEGRDPHPLALWAPTVTDGARGVKFIAAVVESSRHNGAWIDATLDC